MRLELTSRLLFIIYCVEAGAVLLLAPWGRGWDRFMIQIAIPGLRDICLHPLFRSLISAFGLLHLIWAVHDAVEILRRRRSRERPTT